MARKIPVLTPSPDSELLMTCKDATQKLGERIELGRRLHERQISNREQLDLAENEYNRWNSYNVELLERMFTTRKYAEEYSWFGFGIVVSSDMYGETLEGKRRDHKKSVLDKVERLESIRSRLDLIPVAAGGHTAITAVGAREHTNKVFIVHGHDEAARESVARFLERIGIEAVILHEQPTEGRTIVEKLERYADVDFAIILLTPDDIGGAATSTPDMLQKRARQNVILELGFFVGKLGRKHVCALYRGPLELPSDYVGVCYIPLDENNGWHLQLAKELRASGFSVDMNAL